LSSHPYLCLHWTCPVETPDIQSFRSHAHFPLLRCFQIIRPSPRPCVTFRTMRIFFTVTSCSPHAHPSSWRTSRCQLCATEKCTEHLDKCQKKDYQYFFWITVQKVGRRHKRWTEPEQKKKKKNKVKLWRLCAI
jgi:hypothetical protein